MNFYILMLVLIIGFVVGFVAGFLLVICCLRKEQCIISIQEKDLNNENDIDFVSQKINENAKANDVSTFKDRMLDMEDSWTDMNCELDNISKKDYVQENRGKQDVAYKYISIEEEIANSTKTIKEDMDKENPTII